MIIGNVIGGVVKTPQTIMLRDNNGNVFTAVATDELLNITATADDLRKDSIAITKEGLTVGTKVIPAYHTNQGVQIITPGSRAVITRLDYLDVYDFTKLQALVCNFNSSLADSVYTTSIGIDKKVYNVLSTEQMAEVVINHNNKTIDFGFSNDTDKPIILRFFTYKEI